MAADKVSGHCNCSAALQGCPGHVGYHSLPARAGEGFGATPSIGYLQWAKEGGGATEPHSLPR
jgi:hypothetical protein